MSEKIDYKEVMIRMKMDVNYIAEEAYHEGYEDAKLIWSSKTDEESYKRGLHDGNDIGYKDGVNDGRNEAWEAARKVILSPDEGGTSLLDLVAIFGDSSIQRVFRNYSASEAIAKLKAYEEKRKADEEIGHDIGKWKDIVEGIECAYGTCGTCGTRIPMAYKYYEYCPHCGTKNEVTT